MFSVSSVSNDAVDVRFAGTGGPAAVYVAGDVAAMWLHDERDEDRMNGMAGRLAAAALIGAALAAPRPARAQQPAQSATPAQGQAKPAEGVASPPVLEHAYTSRVQGNKDAPVTVLEIADFQCPFCGRFATQVFPRVDSAYVRTGKVQWVFVNMPLSMHLNAWVAAEAALCAGGVANRFWAMHDKLYAGQQEWADLANPAPVFLRYARAVGVPEKPFEECTADDRVAPLILKDVSFAAGNQISGTPSYVVNQTQLIVGAKSYDEWKQILDKAIQDAQAKKKP